MTNGENNIEQALNRIRKKLLDLSRRNRLLNFRAGSRSLTFVDTLPDRIFKTLVLDGGKLHFSPLPEPDLITNIELPAPNNGGVQVTNHVNNFLQTELYTRDLERRLKKISGDAQTAIEESGTNILYLVIGFLEWYEDDNSDQKNRAPLILIPVSLERGKLDIKSFQYKYSMSYTGEDITSNLSLEEKLKHNFGIVLPKVDEELEPDYYLGQVITAIAEKKQWQVVPEIVLGMFSFGKLLMYLDLNPAKWPRNNSIVQHKIIGTLLEGATEADGNPYGETYKIDTDPQAEKLPLVVDADSSQHSAIIDAVAGRNLVIEGPPGTGKSQTITNLIAVTLAQGKSVLFVAEKMAALEVVRRNLDNAGLGDFCLELHSHKTQKQKLLKDIDTRLKKKYRNVEHLAESLAELNKLKKKLQDYVDVINESYGQTEMSVHEILWRAERARAAFTNPLRLQIDNPKKVSRLDITEILDALNAVRAHWGELEPNTFSLWNGYSLEKFYQPDESDFDEILSDLNTSVSNLIAVVNKLPPEISRAEQWTIDAISRLIASHHALNNLPNTLDSTTLAIALLDDEALLTRVIESALREVNTGHKLGDLSHGKTVSNLKHLRTAFDKLAQIATSSSSTKMFVERIVGWRTDVTNGLKGLELAFKEFLEITKLPFPEEFQDVREFCNASRLAASAPSDLIAHAKPSMLSGDSLQLLAKAEGESRKLSLKRLALEEKFLLSAIPSLDTLKRMQITNSIR